MFLSSFPMTPRTRFSLLIATIVVTTLLALGGYWYSLLSSHARMRADTMANLQRVSGQIGGGVSEQMSAVVRGLNYVMENLRLEYVDKHLTQRRSFDQGVRAALRAFPSGALAQVGVIDAKGYLDYSNLGGPRVYLGDREHFRVHADRPDEDKLFISKPILGRVSQQWTIQFTRPIREGGKFAGVLVLSVSPGYLSKTLERLGLGENDSAGMVRGDGTYLARSANLLNYLGKSVKEGRPYLGNERDMRGSFSDEASHEPVRRTFSWFRLPDLPLVVYVGLSEQDALAPVEREIRTSRRANLIGSLFVLSFMVAIVVLLFRVQRQRVRLEQNENLYRSLFEKNASVKLLIDETSGQIVGANEAACDYYGYTRAQLEALHISDINCLPVDAIKLEMARAKAELRAHFFFSHRLASGEIRQVEVYSGPMELNGRSLLYSIVHDVTERSQLEKRLKVSESRYRTVFDVIPDGMMLVDANENIILWNESALSILGVSEEGLLQRQVALVLRDGQPVSPADYPSRRALREMSSQGLYSVVLPDGGRRWIAVSTRQLPLDADGHATGAVVSFSDISRVVALEESLLISQSVFEAASEGILVTNARNVIVRTNPAFAHITGYSAEETEGRVPSFLASGHHDAAFYQAMYQSLADKDYWEGEVVNRRKDGSIFVEWLKITAVRNREGVLIRYVALLSDITLKKLREQDIWRQAHYDPLTQLPNRTLFMDRLGQSIAQATRRHQQVGVLFIDLDKFKPVNDTYGHQAGDELLRLVANRISGCLRDEDTVARLGGDEFVVLLPALDDGESCVMVAEKILQVVHQPFHLGVGLVEISASIGVARSPQDGATAESLLQAADEAMYAAKADGRATVRQLSN
ncbi:diguanylate cyclase [Azospira sp. I13]|uniref:sensor domain-containing diguanylate cyclase n=1 Tax=Azospira sp. I13 TaxID=1765050 RepID=UPI000D590897|nr:diguanylate cyclase [Azospira sp. I13]